MYLISRLGVLVVFCAMMMGACQNPPANVANALCKPAHVEQPPAPPGVLCEGDLDANGQPFCEQVGCTGEFKQVPVAGACGGIVPASGSSGCRENHGTVDLEVKVYFAYCILLVAENRCECRLRQKTDPVSGEPVTELKSDVCECRNI